MDDQRLATIAQQAKAFHDKCEQQYREIIARREAEEKEAAEREARNKRIAKKFEDTILPNLQALFEKISDVGTSSFLQFVLDTHLKRSQFVISRGPVPAYAFFAIAARSGEEDDEAFSLARYLLFATSADDETSFSVFTKNSQRDIIAKGANEDDSSQLMATFSFDNYAIEDIKNHIYNYVLEEFGYYQQHFQVSVEETEI